MDGIWQQVFEDAKARIEDPNLRVKLAGLLERATECAAQLAAGVEAAQHDLDVIAATAAHLGAAEANRTAAALEAAAVASIRKLIWAGVFGLAVP